MDGITHIHTLNTSLSKTLLIVGAFSFKESKSSFASILTRFSQSSGEKTVSASGNFAGSGHLQIRHQPDRGAKACRYIRTLRSFTHRVEQSDNCRGHH